MRIRWQSIKNWLQTHRDSIKSWSETLKNYTGIIGIVLAAMWTYQMFIKKDAPSLESRINLTSSLNLRSMNGELCDADFRVDLENTGISSFEIRRIRIRAWKFDRNQLGGTAATYIDPNEIINKGEQILIVEHTAEEVASDPAKLAPFIKSYSPGDKFGHSFDVVVKKNVPAYVPVESKSDLWLFFLAELYTKHNQPPHKWYTGGWSQMCGIENEKK